MTWLLVVLPLLVQLFGPLLQRWLLSLLEEKMRERGRLPDDPTEFRAQLADVFDEVGDELGWGWWPWNWGKRAAVRVARRQSLERSQSLFEAIRTGRPPRPLTLADHQEWEREAGVRVEDDPTA